MSYMKSVGTSAKGNDRLLKQYGGNAGSSPMARQKYASGGAVKGGNPSLDEGLSAADGAPSKPSLARPGRKMAGKGKGKDAKGKTNVNVVIMQSPSKGAADAGGPPAGPMPPMPPPGPGPGGPPPGMPMRANGGRIGNLGKYAWGGKVKMTTKGDESSKIAKKETHDEDEYAKGGKVCKDGGGPVGLHIDGKTVGAGGGLGRLAKQKMYGK